MSLSQKKKQVPPSTSTPKPTAAPTPAPTPSPTNSSSSFACAATVTASSWQSNSLYYASLNIALTSPKAQAVPYPVSLRIASAITVELVPGQAPHGRVGHGQGIGELAGHGGREARVSGFDRRRVERRPQADGSLRLRDLVLRDVRLKTWL